jgi:hypothetical protein
MLEQEVNALRVMVGILLRFVSRSDRELPGVLDRYVESRAHELVREQR